MKKIYSGRMDSLLLDKLDMVAILEKRSRSFLLEVAVQEFVDRFEEAHGPLERDDKKLKAFRRPEAG